MSQHADRPRARPDVVFRRLADDEWALFDPAANRVHALNLSAAIVWEHCDGSLDVAGLANVVRASFPQPPSTAEADVRSVLQRLTDEGLVTWT
ncbi:MAG: PqqD family protein [Gemmatimonadales bacterium]